MTSLRQSLFFKIKMKDNIMVRHCSYLVFIKGVTFDTLSDVFTKVRLLAYSLTFAGAFFLSMCLIISNTAEANALSDAPLVDLQIIQMLESSGNPRAIGDDGVSKGLYQISEICLKDYNRFHEGAEIAQDSLLEARSNEIVAIWYLGVRIPQMLAHFGFKLNLENVLVAYNCGIGCVVKGYVPKGTELYIRRYKRMLAERSAT